MRSWRILGPTLLTLLAFFTMAVTGASAEGPAQLTAEGGEVIVKGKQIGEGVFVRSGRTIKCGVVESEETAISGSTTFSAGTPTLASCTSSLGGPATLSTNGCSFLFHLIGTATSGEDTWTATADFVCPEGKKGELRLYTTHTNHTNNVPVCVYEYKTQEGLKTIELTNEAAGGETPKDWIRAHIDLVGISSKRIIGSALICGAENDSSSTMEAEAELKAVNLGDEPRGITISTKS